MKDKTKKAKELLENGGWTCVLCGENGEILTSKERGVKPLLEWLKEKEENGKSFQNFSAADKVAGKAAASLYAGLGVEEVYAQVMSISARRTLERYGIAHAFGVETECYTKNHLSVTIEVSNPLLQERKGELHGEESQ